MSEFDVVIIGAGLSGLTAAYTLLKKVPELEVLIIEAKNDIGGRIKTVKIETSTFENFNFDLGAQWISSDQVHVKNLIEELGIELIRQHSDGLKITELINRKVEIHKSCLPPFSKFAQYELNNFIAKIEGLAQNVSFEDPVKESSFYNLDNMSLYQYIQNNITSRDVRNLIEIIVKTTFDANHLSYMEKFITKHLNSERKRLLLLVKHSLTQLHQRTLTFAKVGLNTKDIPLLYFSAFINATSGLKDKLISNEGIGGRQFYIKNGTYSLCSRLVENIDTKYIKKNDPVTSITVSEENVSIQTQSRKVFKASQVIITIPFKEILKINFTPPLSKPRINTLRNIKGGQLIKFILTYKTPFWRSQGHSGQIISRSGPILLSCDVSNENCAAITGFLSDRFQNSQANEIQKAITEQLSTYWGSEAQNPTCFEYKLWSNIEAPIFIPVNASFAYLYKNREHEKRIYFGGSETACYWNGFMNGAVEAGTQAALEVLQIIRPQAITWKDLVSLKPPKRINAPSRINPTILIKYIENVSYYIIFTIGILLACSHFFRRRK